MDSTVVTALIVTTGTVISAWINHRTQGKVSIVDTKVTAVDSKVAAVDTKLNQVQKQTNGLAEAAERLAHAAGFAQGTIDESERGRVRAEEKSDSVAEIAAEVARLAIIDAEARQPPHEETNLAKT